MKTTPPSSATEPIEVRVTVMTVAKIALTIVGLYGVYVFWPLILLLGLAALIAVALNPLLERFQRHLPRWTGILAIVLAIGLTVTAIVYCVIPPLANQISTIAERAPEIGKHVIDRLPPGSYLHKVGARFLAKPQDNVGSIEAYLPHLLTIGQSALDALTSIVLLFAFMTYLLIDGKSTLNWFTSFFSGRTREKISQTAQEITPVVSAYVIGQALTSVLSAIFVFILLHALNVPAALTLAVCAGLFDVLPVIGFFLSVIPALIFASTVSISAVLIIFFAYGSYHLFESYVINPLVYGNRLRISGLGVLVALLVGVTVGGIIGAIVILPVVASYSIIERIWLKNVVGRDVVARHRDLDNEETAAKAT